MKARKITMLVIAKTYPTISSRYNETVCTAGITKEGDLLRLYPICYRSLPKNQRFKKYQWINFKAIRDLRDPRNESYKLTSDIISSDIIGTKQQWGERRLLILSNIEFDIKKIISLAYEKNYQWRSLFVFKPYRIIKFIIIDNSAHEIVNRRREIVLNRLDDNKPLVEDIQYKFYYQFIDYSGNVSTLQLIDWEVYALTRKLMRLHKNDFHSISKVLTTKYFDDIACNKDIYFFLGSNKYWHIRKSKNPFMIIGLFYPPKSEIRIDSNGK